MYKVSPSGIGYLLECPRCLWLFVNENIARPRGIFPSLPSGMDEIFKDYFDIYREKGELPPEINGQIKDAKLFDDMSKLNTWRDINFGRGGLYAEFPEHNIKLRGALDELMIDSKGKYIPFDFKTRGYPVKEDTHEHYQHQLDLYSLLLEENALPSSNRGYLLFFWPKQYRKGTATFNAELVEMKISPESGRKILAEVDEIVSGNLPEAHTDCEYCLYRSQME